MSQGITIFPNLTEALRAGFMVWEKTGEGYTVRKRTDKGFAFAKVVLKK